MDTREFERIKNIISKAEMESVKAQGMLDAIKKDWMKEFNTDDVEEIKKILDELEQERTKLSEKMNELYAKLEASCDWDELGRKFYG